MKWKMTDFTTGKISVKCYGYRESIAFMQMCQKFKLRWRDGMSAVEFIPDTHPAFIYYSPIGNFMCWNTSGQINNTDNVDFADYDWSDRDTVILNRYKVEIECDGTTTTAKLIVDGKEVKSTTAKKHPDDKFSLKLGMETAFNRLWSKDESKTTKKDLKGEFKIGDRVVYTSPLDGLKDLKGTHGTIVVDTGDLLQYGIKVDSPNRLGVSLAGRVKPGHGLWADACSLTLENKKTT